MTSEIGICTRISTASGPAPCPGGGGTTGWVPYISEVKSGSGQKLSFRYISDGTLCRLSEVIALPFNQSGAGTVIARFTYTGSPLELSAVQGNVNSESFTSKYQSPPPPAAPYTFTMTRSRGGSVISEYKVREDGTLSAEGRGMAAVLPPDSAPTATEWHGITFDSRTRPVSRPNARDGTFASTQAGYEETLHLVEPSNRLADAGLTGYLETRPAIWKEKQSCTAPLACAGGELQTWVVSSPALLEPAHVAGERDKRESWVMTPMRYATPSSGMAVSGHQDPREAGSTSRRMRG